MRWLVPVLVVVCVSSVNSFNIRTSHAATLEDVVARLSALEKENASLRARLNRLETPKTSKSANTPPVQPPKAEAAYASIPYKAPVRQPQFNWTGCYLGPQVGASVINDSYTGRNGFGGLAGGQAGCNYQIDRLVFGLEGEASWSGLSNRNTVTTVGTTETSTKNKWTADISTRIGLALTERILSYAKVGAVWGGFNYSTTPAGATTEGSATLSGALIGGGVEYAFSDQWTGRIEYTSNFMRGNVNFGALTSTQSAAIQSVKAAVSYYFH